MNNNQMKLLLILIESFRSKFKANEKTVMAYDMGLSDIPEKTLRIGVERCIRECKFFPSVAEVREKCQSFIEETNGTKRTDAMTAWGEVLQQMKTVGYMGKPKFSSPLIDKIVKRFGWVELNSMESDDLATTRAQFRMAYDSLLKEEAESKKNIDVYNRLSEREKQSLNVCDDFAKLVQPETQQIEAPKKEKLIPIMPAEEKSEYKLNNMAKLKTKIKAINEKFSQV